MQRRRFGRGASAAVLDAAQLDGDPVRSEVINQIKAHTPRSKRIANANLHLGSGRSSAERANKSKEFMGVQSRHSNKQHVHVLHGKFNRKPRNAIKSHFNVYGN